MSNGFDHFALSIENIFGQTRLEQLLMFFDKIEKSSYKCIILVARKAYALYKELYPILREYSEAPDKLIINDNAVPFYYDELKAIGADSVLIVDDVLIYGRTIRGLVKTLAELLGNHTYNVRTFAKYNGYEHKPEYGFNLEYEIELDLRDVRLLSAQIVDSFFVSGVPHVSFVPVINASPGFMCGGIDLLKRENKQALEAALTKSHPGWAFADITPPDTPIREGGAYSLMFSWENCPSDIISFACVRVSCHAENKTVIIPTVCLKSMSTADVDTLFDELNTVLGIELNNKTEASTTKNWKQKTAEAKFRWLTYAYSFYALHEFLKHVEVENLKFSEMAYESCLPLEHSSIEMKLNGLSDSQWEQLVCNKGIAESSIVLSGGEKNNENIVIEKLKAAVTHEYSETLSPDAVVFMKIGAFLRTVGIYDDEQIGNSAVSPNGVAQARLLGLSLKQLVDRFANAGVGKTIFLAQLIRVMDNGAASLYALCRGGVVSCYIREGELAFRDLADMYYDVWCGYRLLVANLKELKNVKFGNLKLLFVSYLNTCREYISSKARVHDEEISDGVTNNINSQVYDIYSWWQILEKFMTRAAACTRIAQLHYHYVLEGNPLNDGDCLAEYIKKNKESFVGEADKISEPTPYEASFA